MNIYIYMCVYVYIYIKLKKENNIRKMVLKIYL